MKKSSITAIMLLWLLTGCSLFDDPDSSQGKTQNLLTPARNIAGTWKTVIPVTFNYETDFCSGKRETVAQADWTVTWIITADANNANKVYIEMRFTVGNVRKVNSSCSSGSTGYIPAVSPNFFTGTVSSSALSFTSAQGITFNGSFTTDLIMGTYKSWSFGSGEFTDSNALKLVRQK